MSAVLSDPSFQVAPSHLGNLRKGESAVVSSLSAALSPEQSALRTRLLELGFVPGERVRIVAESFPHRDPIAVKLGNTTFALRRHEAALIHVMPVDGDSLASAAKSRRQA
ncbi:FeoA family protein [Noviherbaspirillum galbum]|uniref:Ferrous iron transport protein A n=1 Tax=Noviherbaspirillum galbum TaxID=2709383 RepID=A0A6B3SN62_9BURK|nr:FeoA family protein [Noviherbaspirillum galbum]NEX59832.1 ferrous iron transport protein A [Noviherbaspirillum galbum]